MTVSCLSVQATRAMLKHGPWLRESNCRKKL